MRHAAGTAAARRIRARGEQACGGWGAQLPRLQQALPLSQRASLTCCEAGCPSPPVAFLVKDYFILYPKISGFKLAFVYSGN